MNIWLILVGIIIYFGGLLLMFFLEDHCEKDYTWTGLLGMSIAIFMVLWGCKP